MFYYYICQRVFIFTYINIKYKIEGNHNKQTTTMSSLLSCQTKVHGRRIGFNVVIFELTSLCFIIFTFTTRNNVVAQLQQSSSFLEDDACLDNYEISSSSIIRTHDSQKLGAKYINETDLGYAGSGVKSREECLKLCCRTPKCSVIVFEEKKTGSCYLFDCGTPEDFRCKFTTQPQYTSAILRKPNLNQHENELNQLRMGDAVKFRVNLNPSNNNNNINNGNVIKVSNEHQQQHETENEMLKMTTPPVPAAQPIVVNTNSLQPQPKLQLQQQQKQQEEEKKQQDPQTLPSQQQQRNQIAYGKPTESKCSRNQFECKSNSECIAIYNVCDAIPQCTDGSDEAPELNCPAPDTPNESQVQKVQVSSGPGSVMNGKGGEAILHNSGQEGMMHNQHDSLSQQEFLPSQQQQQPTAPLSPGSSGISSSNSNNNNNNNNGNANGKPDQIISTQQMFQPQHSPIFSHKNSGVMEENYGSQRSPFWKPTFDYPLSSGDMNNNNNNNGYSPINPAAGLYGGNGNVNNNGYSSSSSSYTYPQYPSQGMPSIQSPFSQQQQQYLPYNPNNLNVNNLLQPQQQPTIQQQQQQQQMLQNNPYYNSNSNTNSMSNVRPGSNVNNQNMNIGTNNQNSGFTINSPSRILPSNNNNINNNNNNRLVIPQGNSPIISPQQPSNAVSNNASLSTTKTVNNDSSVSAIKVSYSEISKLEIPQSFRKLSSQIQSFAAEAESDLSDHTAGTGAVLVFIMGVCMSACMVVIVGCRLRKIGNRRRGKNRLDSDYLVDGMYL